jgi:hypothetical protein
LATGLGASLLAVVTACTWVAIGSLFLGTRARRDPLALPVALLIGSGIAAAALAVLTRASVVIPGALGVWAAGLAVLVARRGKVAVMVSGVLESCNRALPDRALYWAGAPAAALLWLNAIAPARDADSMRYHLAHVRQIAQDGGWKSIADYHYALPFGWTLNYLPFELMHLPQAAQLLNAFLLVVMFGTLLALLSEQGVGQLWLALVTALVAHPFVVRTFTGASADGYAIFVVFTVAAILFRADEVRPGDAFALGFVSWIGAQSRYQLVAIGLAAFGAVLLYRPAGINLRGWIKPFAAGAAGALLLSSPFYLANLATFGNPVWPLAVHAGGVASSYADIVAARYTRSLSGSFSPGIVIWGITRLFTTPELAPLPVAIVLILAASVTRGRRSINRLVAFGAAFLMLWIIAQPRLYPRFILLLLPVAALLVAIRFGVQKELVAATRASSRRYLVAITLAVFTLISAATSLDQIRYDVTGDAASFHRFTWFYPVYAWVNRALPADARLLVIVYSGHSYYLERQYRRADPWLSAVVDWRRVDSAAALDSVLAGGRYDYVVYDDRDWSAFAGGASMTTAVKQSVSTGALVPVRLFRIPLYTSRVRRQYDMATVYVFARARPRAAVIFPR